MGHQFTIEGDEAFNLAAELSALTGETLDIVVTTALRDRLAKERAHKLEFDRLMAMVDEFHALLGDNIPSSDHSWLYDDETGLPA